MKFVLLLALVGLASCRNLLGEQQYGLNYAFEDEDGDVVQVRVSAEDLPSAFGSFTPTYVSSLASPAKVQNLGRSRARSSLGSLPSAFTSPLTYAYTSSLALPTVVEVVELEDDVRARSNIGSLSSEEEEEDDD